MMIKYLDPEGESMDNEMDTGFMEGYMKTVAQNQNGLNGLKRL